MSDTLNRRRGGVIRVSPDVLVRLFDLPDGTEIVAARESPDWWQGGRVIELTVIGPGMPEYELGNLPPYINVVYVRDETPHAGARLDRIEVLP